MFGFVCGRLAAGNWRLIPMVGTSIAASFATVKFMFDSRECALSFRRVGAIMLAVSVICSFVNCKEIIAMPKDYGKDDAKHVLAEFLVDNGLEYGYADFWTAHATTVIADSEVKIRSVTISREEGICVYTYQSNINWFYDQEGIDEYFIVMTEYEYGRISDTPQWAALMNHQTRKLSCGSFIIFVFDVNPCTFQG
jgi:hypothetical protein